MVIRRERDSTWKSNLCLRVVVLGVGFVSKKVGRTNGGLGVVDSRIRENNGG